MTVDELRRKLDEFDGAQHVLVMADSEHIIATDPDVFEWTKALDVFTPERTYVVLSAG